jgi:hypothetical protein
VAELCPPWLRGVPGENDPEARPPQGGRAFLRLRAVPSLAWIRASWGPMGRLQASDPAERMESIVAVVAA